MGIQANSVDALTRVAEAALREMDQRVRSLDLELGVRAWRDLPPHMNGQLAHETVVGGGPIGVYSNKGVIGFPFGLGRTEHRTMLPIVARKPRHSDLPAGTRAGKFTSIDDALDGAILLSIKLKERHNLPMHPAVAVMKFGSDSDDYLLMLPEVKTPRNKVALQIDQPLDLLTGRKKWVTQEASIHQTSDAWIAIVAGKTVVPLQNGSIYPVREFSEPSRSVA